MKDHRPKNLNLLTIRQPITAIASILHRISGLVLFLAIPLILWVFYLSLSSYDSFDKLHDILSTPFAKLMIFSVLAPFIYHFVAGIRHLLMDVSIGDNLQSGRLGAKITLILSIILIVLIGIWLW